MPRHRFTLLALVLLAGCATGRVSFDNVTPRTPVRGLQARPYVDRARIGIIGWSNGGAFSMAAVNGPTAERAKRRGVEIPPPGYRAAVGVYPGACASLIDELSVRPVLILIGSDDD